LSEVQLGLLDRAIKFRDENLQEVDTLDELEKNFSEKGDANWCLAPWAGSNEEEEALSKKHRISIRCFPVGELGEGPEKPCVVTGKPTTRRAVWARSY